MDFIRNLIIELFSNGKSLIAYVLYQLPYTSSFPGLKTSYFTMMNDRTTASYIDFGIQVLMALAAFFRSKKILVAAATK